ncbi:MAG: YitT family protein, partial [Muribaculaceae bacterium]|nr:YitT family protein [Muribaculaceae bacterium]
MQLTKTRLYCEAKDYFFIVLGIFMYGFGFSAFIAPEGVVIGGMAGFGQDIYYLTLRLFGWGVPVAITMYAANATLLLIAFRVVGRQFVIRTIFGATMMSLAIGILQPLFPVALLHGQKFLSILIGSLFCGVGIGLAFIHNGSTAGVDIIAAMIAKRSNVSIGRTMQFVDFCIVSSSLLIKPDATIENVAIGIVI